MISANNDTVSSAAIKMITNDTNAAVYFAVIDVESTTDITKTTTSYVLPSYDTDTEPLLPVAPPPIRHNNNDTNLIQYLQTLLPS